MKDEQIPVILGVGQCAENPRKPNFIGLSPRALAINATHAAISDAGGKAMLSHIDRVTFVRTFGDSVPQSMQRLLAPFGEPTNYAASVAHGIGRPSAETIYTAAGGDAPSRAVKDALLAIERGDIAGAVITGAEALLTQRLLAQQSPTPDWTEHFPPPDVDEGQGLELMDEPELASAGAWAPIDIYPLLENAHRAERGMSLQDYDALMGSLFSRMSAVATTHPQAFSQRAYSATELLETNEDNRLVATPHRKRFVARDNVNQSAAIVVTSLAVAKQLGRAARCIHLHGHGESVDSPVLTRPTLGQSEALISAYRDALQASGLHSSDIALFDLYSCFPVAVLAAMQALELDIDDARDLTVTGGLSFFGGPGNNYSLHAIATMVERLRAAPSAIGLVGANGGHLTKHAVGIYSAKQPSGPLAQRVVPRTYLAPRVKVATNSRGSMAIETYTVRYQGDSVRDIIAIGKDSAGERLVAKVDPDDGMIAPRFLAEDPVGAVVQVEQCQSSQMITQFYENA
jgi:acetyl-CoA C-acetyltransferase